MKTTVMNLIISVSIMIVVIFILALSLDAITIPSIPIVDNKSDFYSKMFKVTAYCPCKKCCGQFADGITASGYRLRKGNKLCAANLPFCTILKIPGYGVVPVLDRGGAIKEGCIDVYFDTHQEALEWGVQHLKVGIIK